MRGIAGPPPIAYAFVRLAASPAYPAASKFRPSAAIKKEIAALARMARETIAAIEL